MHLLLFQIENEIRCWLNNCTAKHFFRGGFLALSLCGLGVRIILASWMSLVVQGLRLWVSVVSCARSFAGWGNSTCIMVQKKTKKPSKLLFTRLLMVGVTGFEPAASWSRTKRTTKLCHTPISYKHRLLYHLFFRLSRLFSFFIWKAKRGVMWVG